MIRQTAQRLQLLEKKHPLHFLGDAFIALGYLLLGAFSYRLFLRQAIHYPGQAGTYESDLPAHIADGLSGHGYSLAELIYRFFIQTLGLNEKAVAALIALSVLGCVYLSFRFMRLAAPEASSFLLHLFAFICAVEAAIYIPAVNPYHYFGVQGGSCWHNDTYTIMRFAALPVLFLYRKIDGMYLKKIRPADFAAFTIFLTLANWVKPNFVVAFAPAMLIVLIADFAASRGKTFFRQVLFGIPVLLSMSVLVFQSIQLFVKADTAAATTGFPVGLSLAYILRQHARYPVFSLVQSAAFPLVILILNRKKFLKDRFFRFTLIMTGVGFFEYVFMHENGMRKNDGNFSWGYSFCLFFLFVVCAALYADNIRTFFRSLRETPGWDARRILTACALLLAGIFLLLHAKAGIEFFIMLVQGAPYSV